LSQILSLREQKSSVNLGDLRGSVVKKSFRKGILPGDMRRQTLALGSWIAAAFIASAVAACGDTDPSGAAGHGGATGTTTSATGGAGGTGGVFNGCDACAPDTPVCVDNKACAAVCPAGRDACHPSGATPGGACCEAGAQCCEAAVFGYASGDLCRPDNEACPLGCPGSDVACPLHTYCELDAQTGTYQCKDACDGAQVCGFNLCCPVGSRCVEGDCELPDLTIDAGQMAITAHVEVVDFPPDSCEIFEGCVGGAGKRTLLRFDVRTPNIGQGDLFLGTPENNGLFQFSQCHGHYHFTSYADYRLFDAGGAEVAFGHKQAFCLMDTEPVGVPMGDAKYTCAFQGISAGWSDVYAAALPCQWVDVTDVAPGEYKLHVAINYAKVLTESSYDNNTADVGVVIPPNSCPGGCKPVDPDCCQPGDPCGWAGNASCDCADHFGWDGADCGSCLPTDPACLVDSTCPAGCTENTGACCADGDPCGLGGNFACDCAGAFAWDDADCLHCNSADPPCPANSCPNGCTPAGVSVQCCQDGNPCGWSGDGFCDCGGTFAWDAQDCGHCTTVSPDCPQP